MPPVFEDMKKFIALICTVVLLISAVACAPSPDPAAIKTENFSLSRGELAYFFVRTMQSALSSYTEAELSELGYDRSISPSEQLFDGDKTWYDVFMDSTLAYTRELLALCEAAREAGVSLDESDRADLKLNTFRSRIEETYSASFSAYLDITYYGYTSEAEFARAFELELLANKYMQAVSADIYEKITSERIAKHIADNIDEPNDEKTKSVMIIVTDSKKDADEILAKYPATAFDVLARELSLSNEYLFESCRRGELRPKLDEWLFAADRSVGDIGIIEDGSRVSVIYYFEDSLTISELEAQNALAKSDYAAYLDGVFKKFPLITNEEVLATLDI